MSLQIIGIQYDISNIIKPSRDVTLYIDSFEFKDDNSLRIYIQQEPVAINNRLNRLKNEWHKFHAILTYNDEILKTCPNSVFFYFQTITWLQPVDYLNVDTSQKLFRVSNLTGFKQMCPAHVFRQAIYGNQHLFNKDLFVFFRSSAPPILPAVGDNPILGKGISDKIELFRTFQFSLIIENTKERHCYTEKLMDCLLTKTIPIYYGCENIQDYFDTTGWIIIENESVEEIVEKCKVLHKDYYSQYTSVIEKNYQTALSQLDNYKRLNDVLIKIPGYKD